MWIRKKGMHSTEHSCQMNGFHILLPAQHKQTHTLHSKTLVPTTKKPSSKGGGASKWVSRSQAASITAWGREHRRITAAQSTNKTLSRSPLAKLAHKTLPGASGTTMVQLSFYLCSPGHALPLTRRGPPHVDATAGLFTHARPPVCVAFTQSPSAVHRKAPHSCAGCRPARFAVRGPASAPSSSPAGPAPLRCCHCHCRCHLYCRCCGHPPG